jgi:AP-3 complex subunit mu
MSDTDRFKKWDENRLISFIPPDGHFKLLEYQAAKPASGKLSIPLSLKPVMTLGDHGG